MKYARGLSLVELVVTISITLILASVSIGTFVGVNAWRESTAIRRVHADLSFARARAMLSGCRTLCEFDLGKQAYELSREPQPGTGKLSTKPLKHPQDGLTWRVNLADLASGVRIKGLSGIGGNAIGFGADGLPIASNGKTLGNDIEIRFNTGAQITLAADSGLCEIVWP
ncbi:MAG: prepilin-type N-terminal cleavage/methylation domain-containing protein [Phycisphaerae bacterium]|nr:prepilin-type N-terminal cleavage/methylation domain-containing protein [Phycisphaerae bacterium]